ASLFHKYSLFELAVILRAWVKKSNLGRVLLNTLIKLDGKWTPAPDIAFVASRHLKRAKERRIEGPADLAIEVLSRGSITVDRKIKFAAYAKHGIPWYWIVDLKARVLEEYELVDGKYANPAKAPFDEPFKPRLFPGLVIDLASLEWESGACNGKPFRSLASFKTSRLRDRRRSPNYERQSAMQLLTAKRCFRLAAARCSASGFRRASRALPLTSAASIKSSTIPPAT